MTKHGHGLDPQYVADVEEAPITREFREYKTSQKHTTKDVVLIVVIAVLGTIISCYLTNRWYGL